MANPILPTEIVRNNLILIKIETQGFWRVLTLNFKTEFKILGIQDRETNMVNINRFHDLQGIGICIGSCFSKYHEPFNKE